jgi:DNA-binding LacI/PurR family transcriptional regulator
LIGKETKERIQMLARENHFQINIPARRLSLQQSRTIAFVIHAHGCDSCFSVADLFSFEVMGAVSLALYELNYDLLIAHVDPHDKFWAQQYMDTGRVDGFILLTTTCKQNHIKSLLNIQAPFITWGVPQANRHYCSVTGDNFEGHHLVKNGHQNIAFIGGPEDDLEAQQRFEGFKAALNESHIPIEQSIITFGEYSVESAMQRMQKLLDEKAEIDAVFANSDLMAIGVIKTIKAMGKRVPEDIAVVGYDNLSVSELYSPAVTTISQNIPTMGRLLAQNLVNYLQTRIISNVTVPSELIVRQSG